ncbi:MAG: hypothetical protein JOZ17_14185 [Acetobacteraceae bacterium]|nr:hypothetical protein [Acetobacteraceae bacterium]
MKQLGVDVIVAGPFEVLPAAKASTSRVPIVMTPSADLAVAGIVASLDHPGGNITGITEMMPELAAPRFALLKEIVPGLRRVAVLWRPGTLSRRRSKRFSEIIETSAYPAGGRVQLVDARQRTGIEYLHAPKLSSRRLFRDF